MSAQPKHEHDCDICEFLGTAEQSGIEYDLYVCQGRELIARYGVEGDYSSWRVADMTYMPADHILWEAHQRWVEQAGREFR